MREVFDAVARALVAAAVWGLLLAWFYDATPARGVAIGLAAWGPAIILSARWRDAPLDDAPLDAFGP